MTDDRCSGGIRILRKDGVEIVRRDIKWKRQIYTNELSYELLWTEFRHLLKELGNRGYKTVEVLFGWEWGFTVYGDNNEWEYVARPIDEIEIFVKAREEANDGELGSDDLFIRWPDSDLEFQFCHETDLHIWFNERTDIIREISHRWSTLGYEPKEYIFFDEKWIEQPADGARVS